MSNKIKLQEHATDLQAILDTINSLPEEGLKKAFAVIGVTYPEGSICTCSNGVETLELDDTIGYGFFLIPEPQTLPEIWTIKITDGTNIKTQNIAIASKGRYITVELFYNFTFYRAGDNGSAWETYAYSGGSFTFGESEFTIYSGYTMGGYSKAAMYHTSPIKGGAYTSLIVDTGTTIKDPSDGVASVGLVAEADLSTVTSGSGNPTCVA